jgi:circadian clock protein KaiB
LLKLHVSGETGSAARALENCRRLIEACQETLAIDIIDIESEPQMAETASILATPTLSDESLHPPRRLIGDFGDIGAALEYFSLIPAASSR